MKGGESLNHAGLGNQVRFQNDELSSNSVAVNLNPKRRTYWVCFVDKIISIPMKMLNLKGCLITKKIFVENEFILNIKVKKRTVFVVSSVYIITNVCFYVRLILKQQ